MKRLFYTLSIIVCALLSEHAAAQVKRIGSSTRTNNGARLNLNSPQGQLQGTIFIADNIVPQLQQGWNANISQAVGTQLKVELWQVNYVPEKKDNTFTDILLVQKLDANISYQLVQNSVQYSASYRPIAGNVVAIVYTSYSVQRGHINIRQASSNLGTAIKISGKPSDGIPASITHQFKSDVKKYLGNNIMYGIYSLPPRSDNFSNADFRMASSSKTCANCDWISDGWNAVSDAVSDAVNDVGDILKTTADGTVTALNGALKDVGESIVADGATFMVQAFGAVATFVQTGDFPRARMLSDYGPAYDIANSTIFMQTLPPKDKIIVTNLMSINQRMFTVPVKIGGEVYILLNMGKAFYNPLTYSWNGYPGDVFIHELTHAWQIWHIDALKLVEDGAVNQFRNTVISDQYHYGCDGHNISDSYNEEQQAMIVENFYTLLFSKYTVLYDNSGKPKTCNFEQQWVVQNILKNQPSNIDAQFTATKQIILASFDGKLAATGGVIDHALAFPSNGNRTDGTGYFLPGKNNNSFFYYSNKTKTVSANWGPVRDKFTKENYEFGELGWPEMNETLLPDGAGFFQRFDHGFIYWNQSYGAHVVLNKIFGAWASVGWEAGKLGYPVSDYISENRPKANNSFNEFADKGYQKFAKGVIFYALPSLAIAQAQENKNFTTIEYGDPEGIIAEHNRTSASLHNSRENLTNQQQPPPPPRAKPNGSTVLHSSADAVQINPQPLPPDPSPNAAVNRPGGTVPISPQPFPPKIKRSATAKPSATKVQINPQPLPPKQN